MTENEAEKEDVKNPPKVRGVLWGEDEGIRDGCLS
jgi:hypothetical protein